MDRRASQKARSSQQQQAKTAEPVKIAIQATGGGGGTPAHHHCWAAHLARRGRKTAEDSQRRGSGVFIPSVGEPHALPRPRPVISITRLVLMAMCLPHPSPESTGVGYHAHVIRSWQHGVLKEKKAAGLRGCSTAALAKKWTEGGQPTVAHASPSAGVNSRRPPQ
jgi:hypothetical protein